MTGGAPGQALTPLGVGLVGCGGFAEFVLDAVAGLPGLRIAAVVDPSRERAERLGARHGVPALASLDELLDRDDVAAVLIATPPATHAAMAISALRAGRHVFCEKPLATTTEDASAVAHEARLAGRVLVVDHVLRYNPLLRAVRRLTERGCSRPRAGSCSRTTPPTRTWAPTTGSGTRHTAAASSSSTASTSSTPPAHSWTRTRSACGRPPWPGPEARSTW